MKETRADAAEDRGAGLDVLIVAPGFPASEEDDQCLPALQVLWKAMPVSLPDAKLRAMSLHYPFRPGVRTWQGIPVTDIGGRNRMWPPRLLALTRAYRALDAMVRDRRPDLIHTFFLRDGGVVAAWFARRHAIPCIGTLVGQDSRAANRYLRFQSMLTSVVVESERAGDLFFSNTGRRGVTIPWGVEPFDGVLPDRRSRSIDLLGVGTLSPLKDFSTFVRVAAILHREGRIRRAVLLGDGPERAMLEAQIGAAGLENIIECRGSVERALALATMADARVLLHPSRYEGFGMVFAEAQSRGMSIVSRAVGFAAASSSWSLGESDSDFVEACRAQLSPGFAPEAAGARASVRTAAQRYAALYRQVIGEFRGGAHAE